MDMKQIIKVTAVCCHEHKLVGNLSRGPPICCQTEKYDRVDGALFEQH